MGRPKIPKEKHRVRISYRFAPDTLSRIEQFQQDWIKAHGYRLTASQAVERLILTGLDAVK